jgi:hypothetical protein
LDPQLVETSPTPKACHVADVLALFGENGACMKISEQVTHSDFSRN